MKVIRRRSLFKTLSWRAVATLATIVIVYAFAGRLALSLGIGSVEVVGKTILYYAHERVWSRVKLE